MDCLSRTVLTFFDLQERGTTLFSVHLILGSIGSSRPIDPIVIACELTHMKLWPNSNTDSCIRIQKILYVTHPSEYLLDKNLHPIARAYKIAVRGREAVQTLCRSANYSAKFRCDRATTFPALTNGIMVSKWSGRELGTRIVFIRTLSMLEIHATVLQFLLNNGFLSLSSLNNFNGRCFLQL